MKNKQAIPNRYLKLAVMLLLVGGVLLTSHQAQADPGADIRIDYGPAASATGGNWNDITAANYTNVTALNDFNTGAATGVSVLGTATGGAPGGGDLGAGAWNGGATEDWLVDDATRDIVQSAVGTSDCSVTFSGLTASSYKVESLLWGVGGSTVNIDVDGNQADRNYHNILGDGLGTAWNYTTAGLTNHNWLIWDVVTPTGGNITLNVEHIGTSGCGFEAVRLVGGAPSSVGGVAEYIEVAPSMSSMSDMVDWRMLSAIGGLLLLGGAVGLVLWRR